MVWVFLIEALLVYKERWMIANSIYSPFIDKSRKKLSYSSILIKNSSFIAFPLLFYLVNHSSRYFGLSSSLTLIIWIEEGFYFSVLLKTITRRDPNLVEAIITSAAERAKDLDRAANSNPFGNFLKLILVSLISSLLLKESSWILLLLASKICQ